MIYSYSMFRVSRGIVEPYYPTVPRKDVGGQVVDLNTSTKCNTPGSYELPYAL